MYSTAYNQAMEFAAAVVQAVKASGYVMDELLLGKRRF